MGKRFGFIAIMLVIAGVVLFPYLSRAGYEKVPHRLIERAWERRLSGAADSRPWPWLDSVPVARLIIPDLDKDFIVMQGASGDILPFAPGWHQGTAPPGEAGISLISAYSDRHFGFLRDVQPGLEIILQDPAGYERRYTVRETRVVQDPEIRVPAGKDRGTLLLSTSFPFNNWQQGANMNLIVVAVEKPPVNVADNGTAGQKA